MVPSKLVCKMNKDYIGVIKILSPPKDFIYPPIDFDLVYFPYITLLGFVRL